MASDFTASELAAAKDVTRQAIHKRAKSEKWPYQGGKKGKTRRYALKDLPSDMQAALAKTGKISKAEMSSLGPEASLMLAKDKGAVESSPYIRIAGSMPKSSAQVSTPVHVGSPELPDWNNRIALARVDFVTQYLSEKDRAKSKGRSKVEAAKLFVKGFNTGRSFPGLYETLGKVAFSTAEGWVRTWKASGHDYTALATKHGCRKGQRKVTPEEFNSVLSFALHRNRLRKAEAIRLAKRNLERRGIDTPSSIDTLRRALDEWISQNYDRWVFCREGEKALVDKCLPYLERDAGLLEVGEVLVADGHKLNFEILHPETGKAVRMMWVAWYDWASCMPAGWSIMPTENTLCVAAAFRRAVLNLGMIPKVAYLDNGRAFKAKVFNDPNVDFEELGYNGMFGRLGVETIFAWPYNAQSKPVERFFETFGEMERLMPSYTGTDIDHKPAHMRRNEKLHKKIHEKRYGGYVPTLEDANRFIMQWVEEYARRPHRGLKGLRPIDVWEAGRGPGVNEEGLRYLMMASEPKPVHRQGVKLFGRYYYDEALYGIKDRVLVRYDLEDLSRVYIYDRTGARLLCEGEPSKPVHPVARISGGPEDVAEVQAQIERKRSLKKQTEAAGREYVESAPHLVAIPGRREAAEASEPPRKAKQKTLPRAEAERIEAEAEKMKVLEIGPRQRRIYDSEEERYEDLLERECKGEELPLDDMSWMRWFETTEMHARVKERMNFIREFYEAGQGGEGRT
ncbi:MAG: Mu transposase C-terminal domain-containing protein [Desulfobacteraceae bacterium]|jgi:putative transposase